MGRYRRVIYKGFKFDYRENPKAYAWGVINYSWIRPNFISKPGCHVKTKQGASNRS